MKPPPPIPHPVSAPVSTSVSEREKETLRPPAFCGQERPSGIRQSAKRGASENISVAISSIPVPMADGTLALTWELIHRGADGGGVPERLALKGMVEMCRAVAPLLDGGRTPSEVRVFGATCPANVLFTKDGQAHLPREAQSILPQPRRYTAPEREAGGAVTPTTDVYALGVMLLETLARRELTLEEVRTLEARTVKYNPTWREHFSDPLLMVALRATARRPEHRWPDAAQLAEAIARRGGGRVARREELVALIAMTLARHAVQMSRLAKVPPYPKQPAAFDLLDLPGIAEGSALTPWAPDKRTG